MFSKGSCLAGRFETSCSSVRNVNPRPFHFNVWQNSLQIKKKKKERNSKSQILTLEICFLGCSHFLNFTTHELWSVYTNMGVQPWSIFKIKVLTVLFYCDFQQNYVCFFSHPRLLEHQDLIVVRWSARLAFKFLFIHLRVSDPRHITKFLG